MPASTSRKPRGGKGSASTPQLDQTPPSYYKDAEAALEAGTELEEKAERFAIGWKAEKYFEKSLAMYQRALTLDPTGQDAPYNCARVLFLLATDFYPPPKSLETLHASTDLYRRSLSLASPVEASDGLPSAFYLDVQFNLAVALLALSDQMGHSKESPSTRAVIVNEAITFFDSVVSGQELVLQRQKQEEAAAASATGSDAENDVVQTLSTTEDEGMAAAEDSDGQVRSEYTSSLITPASALETLHNLHLSSLAMLDLVGNEGEIQSALKLSTMSLQRAQAVFAAFPDGDSRSPDNEWSENASLLRFSPLEILVAELAKRSVHNRGDWSAVEGRTGNVIEEATREADGLLHRPAQAMDLSTTSGRSMHRIYSEQLEQLGHMLLTLARTLLSYAHSQGGLHDELSRHAWNMLGLASKLLLATLKSLDTSAAGLGASAVLGATHASNATTRRRCLLYTSMSTVSLLRSDVRFLNAVEGHSDKTREQLLNNGRVYARKAVTEVGMGWLLTAATPAQTYSIPHGGLDSLRGEADALLTLLRAVHFRSTFLGAESVQEAEIIGLNVKETLLKGANASTWKWVLFYPDGPNQGEGLLEQVTEEEGDGAVRPSERQFWAHVESLLLQ